jgi:hypothetical protein
MTLYVSGTKEGGISEKTTRDVLVTACSWRNWNFSDGGTSGLLAHRSETSKIRRVVGRTEYIQEEQRGWGTSPDDHVRYIPAHKNGRLRH